MIRPIVLPVTLVWLSITLHSPATAQLGGSRAGVDGGPSGAIPALTRLDKETAEAYITIDGRAEVRVRPTEIRVVLAVTSEAETAQACQEMISANITELKAAWKKLNIPDKNIVEDFIAVLPRYRWKVEKRDNVEVGVENQIGFRMQTNIHLAVANDAAAIAAFKAAFEHGVTDIIAFDYWSQELDRVKDECREKAVAAARRKSETLLTALFDGRPRIINVQERTSVHFPTSLYESFENVQAQNVSRPYRRDIPFVHAARPQNTYYRGLLSQADLQPRELPMHPEISVVSTVRLYFESPAATRKSE